MDNLIPYFIDAGMATVLFLALLGFAAAFYHSRPRKTSDKRLVSKHYDDYYPVPRKVSREHAAVEESGVHKKLNYQFIIERLTRKLYFTFILIVLAAAGFGYILYKTSLNERIAPTEFVMEQYEVMMNRVMSVEDTLERRQLANIESLDSTNRNAIRRFIKEKTVESEDAMVASVSQDFFNIYFYRYIAVRILVATILFIILRYLIRLYFSIREDRSDYIRKEEALSTMFYFLDEIEGGVETTTEAGAKKITQPKYQFMKDKFPDFPLHKLFEGADKKGNKTGKGFDINEVVSSLNSSITLQREMMKSFRDMIDLMRGEDKPKE